jgi:hypothetical protein
MCKEISNRPLGGEGKVVVGFSKDIHKTHYICAIVEILATITSSCGIFVVRNMRSLLTFLQKDINSKKKNC